MHLLHHVNFKVAAGVHLVEITRKYFINTQLRVVGVGECSNFKKKILRTRKIMVMHSNERGECCPRTLVDRKRKR